MFPESPHLFQAFPFPKFGLLAGNSSQGWGLDELRAACISQIWRGGQELLGQVGLWESLRSRTGESLLGFIWTTGCVR